MKLFKSLFTKEPTNVAEDSPAAGGEEGKTPAPFSVSKEQWDTLQANLAEEKEARKKAEEERNARDAELKETLVRFAPKEPEVDPTEGMPDPTEDDSVAVAATKVANKIVARKEHAFKKELRGVHLQTAEVVKETVLKDLPYYKRFKGEVDKALAQLDPAAASNPTVVKKVYSLVIGEHSEELLQEKIAETKRAQIKPDSTGGSAPGTGGTSSVFDTGGSGGKVDLNSLKDFGVTDRQIQIIREKGDVGIQRMTMGRFKTVTEYVEGIKKMQSLRGGGLPIVS